MTRVYQPGPKLIHARVLKMEYHDESRRIRNAGKGGSDTSLKELI
jgi:hypothetical protein